VVVIRQKHTQFKGIGHTESNVLGKPLWPSQAFRTTGLMLLTASLVSLLGGLVQINPIWNYGPFQATTVSAPSQPDWYVGWLEGALRLFLQSSSRFWGLRSRRLSFPASSCPG
jgi:ubiquinol-cytochrome c reductase cytochrome b subunit